MSVNLSKLKVDSTKPSVVKASALVNWDNPDVVATLVDVKELGELTDDVGKLALQVVKTKTVEPVLVKGSPVFKEDNSQEFKMANSEASVGLVFSPEMISYVGIYGPQIVAWLLIEPILHNMNTQGYSIPDGTVITPATFEQVFKKKPIEYMDEVLRSYVPGKTRSASVSGAILACTTPEGYSVEELSSAQTYALQLMGKTVQGSRASEAAKTAQQEQLTLLREIMSVRGKPANRRGLTPAKLSTLLALVNYFVESSKMALGKVDPSGDKYGPLVNLNTTVSDFHCVVSGLRDVIVAAEREKLEAQAKKAAKAASALGASVSESNSDSLIEDLFSL